MLDRGRERGLSFVQHPHNRCSNGQSTLTLVMRFNNNNTPIFPQPFPRLSPPPPSSSSVILFYDPQPLSLPPPLPLLRTLFAGEGDNIHIKRCFVRGDEEEISDLVEGDSPPPPPHDLPRNAMPCNACLT